MYVVYLKHFYAQSMTISDYRKHPSSNTVQYIDTIHCILSKAWHLVAKSWGPLFCSSLLLLLPPTTGD